MLEFNAHDWKVAEKKVTFDLDEATCFVQVRVSSTQAVTLYGVRGKARIPLQSGPQYRCRAKVEAFDALELEAEVAFGYTFDILERQDGEPIDHENPPAIPMPSPKNLVQQFQQMMRDQARRKRLPIAEPEDLPGSARYAIEDEDFDFEEEIFQSQQNPEPENRPNEAQSEPSEAEVPEGQGEASEQQTLPTAAE